MTKQLPKLKVASDCRHLKQENGEAFFYLGDTAWELFHRLNREEATEYLTIRAKQGFTVIQAVVLAENDGLRTPNAYGELPLIDLAPDQPNEKYFTHVDFIVDKAEELGLYIGMLPTWGDKLFSLQPAAGPIVFNEANAEKYGEFLGKRYQDKPIIWILGGDRNVDNFEVLDIWRAMAKGLKKGDQGKHLISYHPRGGASSANWLHNEEWLDFNMYQSGHEKRFNTVYEYAESHNLYQPMKPVVDAEPAYEDIPLAFWEFIQWDHNPVVPDYVMDQDKLIKDPGYFGKGFFTDYDVRVHAYWDLLSGACGYTYGNNAVWQMFKKGNAFAIPCLTDWREALERPGAEDIIHVRALFESRLISKIIPDQSIIYGRIEKDDLHIRAASSIDQSFIIVYLAQGQPVTVDLRKIKDADVVAWWYNPRNGEATLVGEMKNNELKLFTPPGSGVDNDWVLVVDSKAANLGKPGVWTDKR